MERALLPIKCFPARDAVDGQIVPAIGTVDHLAIRPLEEQAAGDHVVVDLALFSSLGGQALRVDGSPTQDFVIPEGFQGTEKSCVPF
jgi:hypothetical protein